MVPHQIYQALTDPRIRDRVADARRHERMAAAKHEHRDLTEPSSRLKEAAAHLMALLHVRGGARARSTKASAAGAGPMGCCA